MSNLPTRDPNKLSDIRRWEQVMQAYLDGDLLTRKEAANDPEVQRMVLRGVARDVMEGEVTDDE